MRERERERERGRERGGTQVNCERGKWSSSGAITNLSKLRQLKNGHAYFSTNIPLCEHTPNRIQHYGRRNTKLKNLLSKGSKKLNYMYKHITEDKICACRQKNGSSTAMRLTDLRVA